MSAVLNWPLGKYVIDREIDRGQFGTVYEARHPVHGSVALKLILLRGQDGDEKVEAERQGAILQQRFSRAHPGLVPQVFDYEQVDGYYAVAMELIRGEALTTLIARGPIAGHRAAQIALELARFLEKAHRFKADANGDHEAIVHGDLKPAHVLLIPDGTIRVLDFGIAKALAARKTATTNKWGSIDYASPERLETGHVNEHADFWALGVMLFEMSAGFRPYRAYEGSPSRLESAIRRQEGRAALPAGLDPPLAAIISKLLAPQPEFRYPSASAIVADLSQFMNGAETRAAVERARASQETVRIIRPERIPPLGSASVPTEPIPHAAARLPPIPAMRPAVQTSSAPPALVVPPPLPPSVVARAAVPVAAAPARAAAIAKRLPLPLRFTANAMKLAVAGLIVMFVALEGMALARADRLVDAVPSLEASDLAEAQEAYARIDRWAPLGLGRWHVRWSLRERLLQLADRTILEFRSEAPALARAQWNQALAALEFAREVAPRDPRIASKLMYVRGRLAWMRADTPAELDEAIRLLREASRLDPSSPDPFLGLATIYAYSTWDLPALTQAIDEAERRGYKRGRREQAELGDVHKTLADRARDAARDLAGLDRIEMLRAASDGYTKCIEHFEGLDFGDSQRTLALCRSRLRSVTSELTRLAPVEPWGIPAPNPWFAPPPPPSAPPDGASASFPTES